MGVMATFIYIFISLGNLIEFDFWLLGGRCAVGKYFNPNCTGRRGPRGGGVDLAIRFILNGYILINFNV